MHLPKIIYDECFMLSNKESSVVSNEFLVFEKELMAPIIYKYRVLKKCDQLKKC